MNVYLAKASKSLCSINTSAMSFNRFKSDGLGNLGSGAGKGGGGGGSIREAGGAMGEREAANEEEYFYIQQRQQVEKMKKDIEFCKAEIEKNIDEITKAKAQLDKIGDKH
ncbi:ATPase inhibitor, mitochondrial-like [Rhopalosiphum padi]|uniref:ATPase inhibitor, mitochondrial-like n=1 Tax=Rhopalosiphum padi TaxID=40932 RepID=UPI00298E6F7A|nr:ATPase inhibitor, mitochondrial-like [Rhopalosiphum padi]XP_060852983.1 ATPase inhibitor, mitochondrial-like [Rhopalosiphum padi]